MIILRYLYLLLILFSPAVMQAEEPIDVLTKMRSTYENARSFSMGVTLKMYGSANEATPVSSGSGTVMMSGNNYFSSLLGKTVLVNNDFEMILDEKQKAMIVADAPASHFKKQKANSIIDTSLYEGMHLTFIERSTAKIRIEMKPDDVESSYQYIRLTINPVNYTLIEVEYLYAKNENMVSPYEKATISYSDILLNVKMPDTAFSNDKYFLKKGNKVIASSLYGSYKVIDQRKLPLTTEKINH